MIALSFTMLTATAADHKTAAPKFVGQIKSGEYKVANPSTTELQVHVYGETAVATRIFWKASETIKGEKSAGHCRFTDTWTKREAAGRWSPRKARPSKRGSSLASCLAAAGLERSFRRLFLSSCEVIVPWRSTIRQTNPSRIVGNRSRLRLRVARAMAWLDSSWPG